MRPALSGGESRGCFPVITLHAASPERKGLCLNFLMDPPMWFFGTLIVLAPGPDRCVVVHAQQERRRRLTSWADAQGEDAWTVPSLRSPRACERPRPRRPSGGRRTARAWVGRASPPPRVTSGTATPPGSSRRRRRRSARPADRATPRRRIFCPGEIALIRLMNWFSLRTGVAVQFEDHVVLAQAAPGRRRIGMDALDQGALRRVSPSLTASADSKPPAQLHAQIAARHLALVQQLPGDLLRPC